MPKIATAGTGRQRLEQQRHLAAAALPPCWSRACSVRLDVAASPARRARDAISSRARGDRRLLEVAAADAAPELLGADDHLRAGLARRVAADRRSP